MWATRDDTHTQTCNTGRPATHCNALQHTATHCNTLQHTATLCNIGVMLWATRDDTHTLTARTQPSKRQRVPRIVQHHQRHTDSRRGSGSIGGGEEGGKEGDAVGSLGAKLSVGYTGRTREEEDRGAGGGRGEDRSGWWPFDGLCEAMYPDLLHLDW